MICILALPSSRSDWFAQQLAESSGLKYWHKEFFNPTCNHHWAVQGFGSEMVSHYKHIVQPEPSDAAYSAWLQTGCKVNKEVFSAFNVEWFAERFRCIGLTRGESMFPPQRVRVLAWYDAIWNSLKNAGHALHADTALTRAGEARAITELELTEKCTRHNIPVLNADMLGDPDYVQNMLANFSFSKKLAESLRETYVAKGVHFA
jgi:hypothetical protein